MWNVGRLHILIVNQQMDGKNSSLMIVVGKKVKQLSVAVICHVFAQNGKEIIQIFISAVHLK